MKSMGSVATAAVAKPSSRSKFANDQRVTAAAFLLEEGRHDSVGAVLPGREGDARVEVFVGGDEQPSFGAPSAISDFARLLFDTGQ